MCNRSSARHHETLLPERRAPSPVLPDGFVSYQGTSSGVPNPSDKDRAFRRWIPGYDCRHAIIALLSLLFALIIFPRFAANASSPAEPPLLYTLADRYEPQAWMRGDERFPAGATIMLRNHNAAHPLLKNFAASTDPAVSFDGKKILFAAKQKPEDHWQIWEMTFGNAGYRQLTNCPDDCLRPFYLPENRILYAEKVEGRFLIQSAMLANGQATGQLRLTYTPQNSLPSDVLRDGRILFTTTTPDGQPELYTVYPDGSGVESYRCDHAKPHSTGRQIRSGDIVFATTTGLGRFTSARAEEVAIPTPPGEYAGDIAETSSGDWLVSWRRDDHSKYQLTRVGRAFLPAQREMLHSTVVEQTNVLQPTLIAEHPAPKRFPTALHDWSYANLLCLNAYTSKYKFAEASIRSIRLYTRDEAGKAKPLGTARVEGDGSFFIQVPGDQPIQIELLDQNGKTLKRESNWFWMRKGEQRICVGCHAGPETAPENAVPMILLRSTTPADLTGAAPQHASGAH